MKSGYRHLKSTTDLSIVRKGVFVSLIYAALNLDSSEIQFSDLMRYIREGRLDISNCLKFIPKEIKFRLVPQWEAFNNRKVSDNSLQISTLTVFKCLDVVPVLPDLKLIVDRFIKELCLPNDFKNLVLSLMHLVPCHVFLELDKQIMKTLLRIPPYEITVMAYILLAFKICFGLDDHYEVKLSDAVEKINDENCHMKSYKLGNSSQPTDRLFSFREWCSFIQLRKIILCKYCLHLAEQYSLDIDDYVYMEQCQTRPKLREPLLSDEITMNILQKIPQMNTVEVIPKSELKPTLTPLSTYTDLVLQYFRDPDLRLLFSEDFTQYSLKYACEKFHLSDEDDVILGVDEANKVINKQIYGLLTEKTNDAKMVYVRNCENKNWLKTNQPSVEHIKTINKSNSDRESDHGYDSNSGNVPDIEISREDEISNPNSEENVEDTDEKKRKLEIIEEEDADRNIFDDDFKNLVLLEKGEEIIPDNVETKSEPHSNDNDVNENSYNDINIDQNNITAGDQDDVQSNASDNDSKLFFNPDTFDRSKTIRELVLAACHKYKIKVPDEYNTKEPKKRKSQVVKDMAAESGAKRRRLQEGEKKRRVSKPGEAREQVNRLLEEYYNRLKNDVMVQLSEHVRAVVNNVSMRQDTENTNIAIDRTNIDDQINDDMKTDDHNINADDAIDNIEVPTSTIADDSSLQVIENDEEENQTKGDPRFDEKEFDIKQLYVKVDGGEDSDSDDPFGIGNDPEIVALLDKKTELGTKTETPPPSSVLKEVTYDSDDDLPLSVYKEEKLAMHRKNMEVTQKLITNQDHITKFKYWTRFYASSRVRKMHSLNEPFSKELQENFPISFTFVIRECAGVLDCSPFNLYKAMVILEQRMLTHNR